MIQKKKERFEVLLEDIKGDVKAIAEGQSGLQGKIDVLRLDVKALDIKIDAVHASLKQEINTTADEHIRQPAHA